MTFAAVIINEVAWMGSADSPNDEWIELLNTGSQEISVDGWVLEDGLSLSISLAGSIGPGGYAVLERTDDTSAPGSAFLVYTGALPNTGATLILKDTSGAIADQVAGGENWETIGGDNVTKDTAQYTTAGWITAPATPGQINATEASPESNNDTGNESVKKSSGSAPVRTRVQPPVLFPSTSELDVSIMAGESGYLRRPVMFEAKSTGIGEDIVDSLVYTWNFGDLSTASGKKVSHVYQHPGEYLVTLHAAYARHEVIAQHKVTVLPVRFSMTRTLSGDIQVHNESPYDVDVSDYTLVGTKTVTFPKLSLLPENGTVTISAKRLGGLVQGQIQLRDKAGALLAVYPPGLSITESNKMTDGSAAPRVLSVQPRSDVSRFLFQEPATDTVTASDKDENVAQPVTPIPNPSASVVASGSQLPDLVWPLFGLIGVIAIGILSAFAGSHQKVTIDQDNQ